MDKKITIAAAIVAPLVGAVLIALIPGDSINSVIVESGDEKPYAGETKESPSKLSVSKDGSKSYITMVKVADGGVEARKTAPDCVRRPVGVPAASCMERTGKQPRDPGDLTRFPAADAIGAGCQPVACSIWFGENAEEDEDKRISDFLGK